jgi:hypothetical protein
MTVRLAYSLEGVSIPMARTPFLPPADFGGRFFLLAGINHAAEHLTFLRQTNHPSPQLDGLPLLQFLESGVDVAGSTLI